jgi:hypothetical protein
MSRENPCLASGVVNIIDPEYTACPQPVYARVLEHFRVAKSIAMHTPILSRYEDVVWALRHPEIFSSEIDTPPSRSARRPLESEIRARAFVRGRIGRSASRARRRWSCRPDRS